MTSHTNKLKWSEVINQIEHAGLNEQTQLQAQLRNANKKYIEILQQEIQDRKAKNKIKEGEKQQERNWADQITKAEHQKWSVEKQEKKKKEKEIADINQELISLNKISKRQIGPLPQHPFIRLVDQQDVRKNQTRQNLLLQNNINNLQTKIKQQLNREQQSLDQTHSQNYNNHINQFYNKKLQQRNIFKRKYLKLLPFQQHQLTGSVDNIDMQYKQINSQQMAKHQQQKIEENQVQDKITKINQHCQVVDSSPAFLGRRPINHDRKKQLQYLNKGLRNTPVRNGKEDNHNVLSNPLHNAIKRTNMAQELPALEQYYSQNLKNKEPVVRQFSHQQSPQIASYRPEVNKIQDYRGVKSRMQTEPCQPSKQRRRFMTFDIILGRQKEVLL